MRIAGSALLTALAVACGGGGPETPTPSARAQLTGYATPDGDTLLVAGISAKGALGPSRANGFSGNPARQYALSTEHLTPPYVLQSLNSGDASVATADGRANITQLTSLLTIALFGQSPVDAFNDYGDASAAQIALIDQAGIRRAQADATEFLEQTVKVPVRSGDASFITTEFEPVAGDPMWDTLVALNRRIAEIGTDAYATLVAGFLQRQQQCRRAQLTLSIGDATQRFCPATSTSTPEAADPDVLAHVYAQDTGETLTVRVRDNAVLDAAYATAGGTRYGCSGAGCEGLALGRAAYDGTRRIVLSDVSLSGAAGRARLTGRVATTLPNVTLPDLPCFVGALWKVRSDGTVDASCADSSSALQILNVSGTLGSQQGASTYADYYANGLDVVLDGGRLVSITALVPSADGLSTITAACRGAGCRGVTVGDATTNSNIGFETVTRPITFSGTGLRTVGADGSLGADTAIRLKGSLRLAYFSSVRFNYAAPTDPPQCTGTAAVVQLVPTDTPDWTYRVCDDGSVPIVATPLESGGVEISFNGQLTIRTDADGNVVYARVFGVFGGGAIFESFGCDGKTRCAGVEVGAPAADGRRAVRIDGATFSHVGYDGYATGPRRARVEASFDAVPSP